MIVGEVFLAILFGYDEDESEVVAPHKKSQVINVVMSDGGAVRRIILPRLRRKRADIVLAILFGYNGNKSKVDPCRREAERVRVKEDRRHIGKTAGAHANLLLTSFRERRAWKQCDRRRGILGYFVWVR